MVFHMNMISAAAAVLSTPHHRVSSSSTGQILILIICIQLILFLSFSNHITAAIVTSSSSSTTSLPDSFQQLGASATMLPYHQFFSHRFNASMANPKPVPFNSEILPIITSISITNQSHLLYSDCFRDLDAISRGGEDLDTERTCHPESSYFLLGDVTKLITSVAVMQVFASQSDNDHKSRLYDSVNQILHDLGSNVELVPNDWDTSVDAKQPVRIVDLMMGTHGLDERRLGTSAPSKSQQVTDLETFFSPHQRRLIRIRPSNEVITPSNVGHTLLGHLVELSKTEGITSFQDYLRKKIFTPLGMDSAHYNYDEAFESDKNFVQPLERSIFWDRNAAATKRSQYGQFMNMAPSLGVYASSHDVAKLLRMLLNKGKSDSGETVLTPQQVEHMEKISFRNHEEDDEFALAGVAPGWTEGIYNGISYLHWTGGFRPYYSTVVLFRDSGLAMSIQSVGLQKASLLTTTIHQFIDEYIKPFKCTDQVDLKFNVDTGKCQKVVPVQRLPLLSDPHSKNGCYSSSEYEHTTWYKIHYLSVPYYCLSATPGSRVVSVSGTESFSLAEDEKGILRRGVVDGENFLFDYPYDQTFGVLKSNGTLKSIRYMYRNQEIFEIASLTPEVWKIILLTYFSMVALCIVLACCCCGNCLCLEGSFIYREERSKMKYRSLAPNLHGDEDWLFEDDEEDHQSNRIFTSDDGESNSADSSVSPDSLDEHEIFLPDPAYQTARSSRKRRLPELSKKSRFALASTTDVISVISISITGLLLLLHVMGMIVSIFFVNPSKLFPQTDEYGLEFWLVLPLIVLACNVISLMFFCCVSFNRLFVKPAPNGCLWIVCMAFVVILYGAYIPVAVHWNWFGFQYSN